MTFFEFSLINCKFKNYQEGINILKKEGLLLPKYLDKLIKKKNSIKKIRIKDQIKLHWSQITEKETKKLRKKYRIKLNEKKTCVPLETFIELKERFGVSKILIINIEKVGLSIPTPIQRQIIPCMLKGENVLGTAPTGSGKTASFAIPILAKLNSHINTHLRCLVISPTKELSQQIETVFNLLAISTGLKASYFKYKISKDKKQQTDVAIVTPQTAINIIKSKEFNSYKLEILILDEVDQLLNGDWIEHIDQIICRCTNISTKHGLFSATLHNSMNTLIKSFINNPTIVTVGQTGTISSTIIQKLIFVSNEKGKLFELQKIIEKGLKIPILIFVQSRSRARSLFWSLRKKGLKTNYITSNLPMKIRTKLIERFRRGDIWFFICTDLLSRGMNFENVETIINYDFPQSTISYIHRCGRTGRAETKGWAITFWTEIDTPFIRNIANIIKNSGGLIPSWMLNLKKLTRIQVKKLIKNPKKRYYVPNIRYNFKAQIKI